MQYLPLRNNISIQFQREYTNRKTAYIKFDYQQTKSVKISNVLQTLFIYFSYFLGK